VTSTVAIQNDEQLTLLAIDYYSNSTPQLYAIDPATGAIGLLVDNLPLYPVSLAAFSSHEVLMGVNPYSLSDPARVILADLHTHTWRTLFTNLQGAFGLAIRPDKSAVLVAEGRADWPWPIAEYNFQTGQTRTFATVPYPHQPFSLAFTPGGRLFVGAGSNQACVLFEFDPITGAIFNEWPGPCESTDSGGRMSNIAYDPRTGDLVGAVDVQDLDEIRVWRFNPDRDRDTGLRVWITRPGYQGSFSHVAAGPDGTLYAAADMGGQNSAWGYGIIKIAPDQTISMLVPPGQDHTWGEHWSWGIPAVLIGSQPPTIGPMATYTPTPLPTATPYVINTPTPTATPRPGQVDVEVTPEPLQVGYFTRYGGGRVGETDIQVGVVTNITSHVHLGVLQFNLPTPSPNGTLVGASLRLVGQSDAQLDRSRPAIWGFNLLYPDLDLTKATFDDVLNASSPVSFGSLNVDQLGVDRVNILQFPAGALFWLSPAQHPAGEVTVRISGPRSSPTDLFAWYGNVSDPAKLPILRLSYVLPGTDTPTPTRTATSTITSATTPTTTPTASPTPSPSSSATPSPSPTLTTSPTATPTGTPLATATPTPSTPTSTAIASDTPTTTLTPSPTATPSAIATATSSPSATAAPTSTAAATGTPTPTLTPNSTAPSPTRRATPTPPIGIPSSTATVIPGNTRHYLPVVLKNRLDDNLSPSSLPLRNGAGDGGELGRVTTR